VPLPARQQRQLYAKTAGKACSSAAGLYVALYFFGRELRGNYPRFFWEKAEWFRCVALILCMQGLILFSPIYYGKTEGISLPILLVEIFNNSFLVS
jgi:hypothetical protein